MTVTVKFGEAFNLAADVDGALKGITAIPNASLNDKVAIVSAVAGLLDARISNPYTSAFSYTSNGLKLAVEMRRLTNATSLNDQISAILGATSALGGMLAAIPLPQFRAAGIAVALAGEAAKQLWDARRDFADVHNDLVDAQNRARSIPIIWT